VALTLIDSANRFIIRPKIYFIYISHSFCEMERGSVDSIPQLIASNARWKHRRESERESSESRGNNVAGMSGFTLIYPVEILEFETINKTKQKTVWNYCPQFFQQSSCIRND